MAKKPKFFMVFAEEEGAKMEVWHLGENRTLYDKTKETMTVKDVWQDKERKINWVALSWIIDDYDATLNGPRETKDDEPTEG